MAMFGLRLGDHPRAMVTTTPKPLPIVRELVKDKLNTVTRSTTCSGKTANRGPNKAKTHDQLQSSTSDLNLLPPLSRLLQHNRHKTEVSAALLDVRSWGQSGSRMSASQLPLLTRSSRSGL